MLESVFPDLQQIPTFKMAIELKLGVLGWSGWFGGWFFSGVGGFEEIVAFKGIKY